MSARNILHVDDSADDLFLLQSACQRAQVSFGLQSVNDGDLAISYLAGKGIYSDRKRHPVPDLVLLDLKMPVTSGYEVLAWIRHHPQLKQLPVIIFTGGIKENERDRVCRLGADEFVEKTGKLTQLQQMALALESVFAHGRVSLKPLQGFCANKPDRRQ